MKFLAVLVCAAILLVLFAANLQAQLPTPRYILNAPTNRFSDDSVRINAYKPTGFHELRVLASGTIGGTISRSEGEPNTSIPPFSYGSSYAADYNSRVTVTSTLTADDAHRITAFQSTVDGSLGHTTHDESSSRLASADEIRSFSTNSAPRTTNSYTVRISGTDREYVHNQLFAYARAYVDLQRQMVPFYDRVQEDSYEIQELDGGVRFGTRRNQYTAASELESSNIIGELAIGHGRMYDAQFLTTALEIVRELDRGNELLRMPERDVLYKLADTIKLYRSTRPYDSRLHQMEAIQSIIDFLHQGNYVQQSTKAILLTKDVWDFPTSQRRLFGLSFQVGSHFQTIRNTSTQKDISRSEETSGSVSADGLDTLRNQNSSFSKYASEQRDSRDRVSLLATIEAGHVVSMRMHTSARVTGFYELKDESRTEAKAEYNDKQQQLSSNRSTLRGAGLEASLEALYVMNLRSSVRLTASVNYETTIDAPSQHTQRFTGYATLSGVFRFSRRTAFSTRLTATPASAYNDAIGANVSGVGIGFSCGLQTDVF